MDYSADELHAVCKKFGFSAEEVRVNNDNTFTCGSTEIEVGIETHNEYATGQSLRKLLDDVNRLNIKIIWEIIHPIEDGESRKKLRMKNSQTVISMATSISPLDEGELVNLF